MSDIKTIPTAELTTDLAETLADIELCELAVTRLDITTYGDGKSVQDRLHVNRKIANAIMNELKRRDVEAG